MTPTILEAAAALIERDGWCQGQAHSSDGRHCALGAIGDAARAAREQGDFDAAKLALSRYLNVQLFGGIEHWNDQSNRTATEVIAALRAAAREGSK